jgi:hypothetical protein
MRLTTRANDASYVTGTALQVANLQDGFHAELTEVEKMKVGSKKSPYYANAYMMTTE